MNVFELVKNVVIGRARNLSDKSLFHKTSLIALLAWVGLGADGLSSSCYGPEAAFLALKDHHFLSLFVAGAVILTIVVICASYSQIIEQFPTGGGGYLVASKLLAPPVGVVSGCALIGDYVLTIAISVASGTEALFSLLPSGYATVENKTIFAAAGVIFLTVINLRGVKESVLLWLPAFSLFVASFAIAIVYGIVTHLSELPAIAHGVSSDVSVTASNLGVWGLVMVIVRAYSSGAGTFTGIEAVSNSMLSLREPRVQTGKRTMVYMGASLAFVAAGLLLVYLLYHVNKAPGETKTLNAILLEQMTATWPGWSGKIFVGVALVSSAALLFIAAQTGFIGGPRVLANMAVDRWMPTRFANLSDRLVTANGILLMGGAALVVVVLTRASMDMLIVLYSINVFITFSLSQLGMVRHWWLERENEPKWLRKFFINGFGFLLTTGILVSLCTVKFFEGGWVTLLVTGVLIVASFGIKHHYAGTQKQLQRLNDLVPLAEMDAPSAKPFPKSACDPNERTAVFLVNGFNGLGLHTLLAVIRMFPKVYKNFVFLQVGVLDAGSFKGAREVENLRRHAQRDAERYADYMRKQGFCAESYVALGTDIVDEAEKLCEEIARRFPQSQFFAGQLVFKNEGLLTRLLHNQIVFELQRRLYQQGWPMLILPIRV